MDQENIDNPIEVLAKEILLELKSSGLKSANEAWYHPHGTSQTHCIACNHKLHMYISDKQIMITWSVRGKWNESKWDIRDPDSIEQAIYWFTRRYQVYEIIKKRC